jgi:hypothetical protein
MITKPTLPRGRQVTRSIAEHATHKLVIRRRLPAPFEAVRIYASSEGVLKYLHGLDPVCCWDSSRTWYGLGHRRERRSFQFCGRVRRRAEGARHGGKI